MNKGNPAAKLLNGDGTKEGDGTRDVQQALYRLCWLHGLEQDIMENCCCKSCRGPAFGKDFIADKQNVYFKKREQYDNNKERTVLYKRVAGLSWQEFTPRLNGFATENADI